MRQKDLFITVTFVTFVIDFYKLIINLFITMVSKASISSFLLVFFFLFNIPTQAQDGESLFKTNCAACHKTSSKKLIGPGLANIQDKRTKEWFKSFVSASQSLINSGDAEAIKIFEEYNKIPMPDQALSDAELDAVFDYIVSVSPAKSDGAVAVEEEEEVPFEPIEEDVLTGRDLFSGVQSFENGGASCISCHNVRSESIISGASLAKDLTDVYERLGKDGTGGVISGLPFPQMKITYQDHQITEDENLMLLAFLKDVSEQQYYEGVTSYQNVLLMWGIGGAIVLMGIFPLFWYKRKKESVNKRIYDRQIKSRN